LDIGSATIKAVQVEPHRFGYRVVRAAQHPTPLRSVRDGVVTEKEAVTEAIQELLAAGKINATGAVLAISGPAVSVRQVRLPHMPDASLRKTIRYEASKFVTTNIEEAALAYEVIGPSEVEAGMDEVMLVAAPNEVVDSRVKVVNA
jgi:type IV pilus assembly protein PilM